MHIALGQVNDNSSYGYKCFRVSLIQLYFRRKDVSFFFFNYNVGGVKPKCNPIFILFFFSLAKDIIISSGRLALEQQFH